MENRNAKRRAAAAAHPPQQEVAPPVPQNIQQQHQSALSYAVPTEIVDLPSKGRFYPVGHPLHGKESIEIRYMTARDEDILTSPALLKKGVALDRLLDNVLLDNSFNSKDLLSGDGATLMYAVRITGYGPDYQPDFLVNIVVQTLSIHLTYLFLMRCTRSLRKKI